MFGPYPPILRQTNRYHLIFPNSGNCWIASKKKKKKNSRCCVLFCLFLLFFDHNQSLTRTIIIKHEVINRSSRLESPLLRSVWSLKQHLLGLFALRHPVRSTPLFFFFFFFSIILLTGITKMAWICRSIQCPSWCWQLHTPWSLAN